MQISRPLGALTVLAALALAATPAGATAAAGTSAGPQTYYVSPAGSDSAGGRSPSTAWRSLSRVNRASLHPGDRVRLRGGSTFPAGGGLKVTASGTGAEPIVVQSYGTGTARISGSSDSCVVVSGSWVRVRELAVTGCTWAGVDVRGDHVDVGRVDAGGSWAGVQVERGASYTTVKNSYIHDNVRATPHTSGSNDDSGAWGVLVNGDHTTINDNTIRRHDIASRDYGRDGAAVEVFAAQHTVIEDNLGTGNQTFTEVGGEPGSLETAGLVVRDNRVTNTATRTFFTTVHAGDAFGTASGVELDDNSVRLTGASSVGVFCGPRCTPKVLHVSGNTISAPGGAVQAEGTYGGS